MSTETTTPTSEAPQQTEIEKLQAEIEKWKGFSRQHESRAKTLERDLTVFNVAKETGLPDAATKFLTATDAPGLKAQAEELKQLMGVAPAAPAETTTAPAVEEAPVVPAATEVAAVEAPAETTAPVVRTINPLQGQQATGGSDKDAALAAEVSSLFNS